MPLTGLRRFLYYPERLPEGMAPPAHARGAEEVWITTADGETVHGLWWEPLPGRPTLLYLHGNAGQVFDWALVRRDLEALQAGLLLIDYRGYGKSSGRPDERGLYLDGEAAVWWLGERGVSISEIVVLGKSLGGGVASQVVRERPFRGLILESTFTSIPSVANHLFPVLPVGALLPDRYETLARLPVITCPVLVVHGLDDELIPVAEGRALFDAASEPKTAWFVEGAGHNDVSWMAGPEYGRRLRAWLDGLPGRPALSNSPQADDG